MFFTSVKNLITDILFPIYCVDCGREGEWWCADCRQGKIKIKKQKADGFLNGSSAFLNDDDGSPGYKLIKQFKYSFATDISGVWQDVVDVRPLLDDWPKEFCIVPVPLHRHRLKERGFNQAELLADLLYKKIIAAGRTAALNKMDLVRLRCTAQQARLNRLERFKNMADAFVWRGSAAPFDIILVDDVYTTGATMRECAKVLRQNGARWIWAFTLARGA